VNFGAVILSRALADREHRGRLYAGSPRRRGANFQTRPRWPGWSRCPIRTIAGGGSCAPSPGCTSPALPLRRRSVPSCASFVAPHLPPPRLRRGVQRRTGTRSPSALPA